MVMNILKKSKFFDIDLIAFKQMIAKRKQTFAIWTRFMVKFNRKYKSQFTMYTNLRTLMAKRKYKSHKPNQY